MSFIFLRTPTTIAFSWVLSVDEKFWFFKSGCISIFRCIVERPFIKLRLAFTTVFPDGVAGISWLRFALNFYRWLRAFFCTNFFRGTTERHSVAKNIAPGNPDFFSSLDLLNMLATCFGSDTTHFHRWKYFNFGLHTTLGLALYGQKEDQPGCRALLGSCYGVTFFKTSFRLHY